MATIDFEYIFKREHPNYKEYKATWERSKLAYSGGLKYIEAAVIQHISEIDLEFEERQKRAYYFNYPRKIARIITQFILSQEPTREGSQENLVEDFSRTGLRANEVMRQFSTYLNIFGVSWLLVDSPSFSGEMDLEKKQLQDIRPYTRALSPLSVVDWAYGADGRLQWVITKEVKTDSSNPLAARSTKSIRRLWTRDEWKVFEKDSDSGEIKLSEKGKHGLGAVPLIMHEDTDGYGMDSNHWFEDVVRISDAILNNESEAQMNIIKQMFGLLVLSESFVSSAQRAATSDDDESEESGDDTKLSHILARSAALWESKEESGISRYIQPEGAPTEIIRGENVNLKKEMYDIVGMAVQKDDKQSQTAESKAWDHQGVTQYLKNRADILEQAEIKAWDLMHLWDKTVKIPKVIYNREFSIDDLPASIGAVLQLDNAENGIELRKQINRTKVSLLDKIEKMDPANRKKILEEIEDMEEAPTPEMPDATVED